MERVWPHMEPCWSHGIALVKAMGYSIKDVVRIAVGFSRLVRTHNGSDTFRQCLMKEFKRSITAIREERPPGDAARTCDIVQKLYGSAGNDEFLWRT